MITMKRSVMEEETVNNGRNSSVALLERPSRVENVTTEISANETTEEARIRMQRNLNRLLNYDRVEEETAVVEEVVEQAPAKATLEEDIRPTSTTLQFGDGNDRQIIQDLRTEEVSDTKSYKLSSKGKFMVVLYSLIVSVILALIIVNTGVLASLDTSAAEKLEKLNTAQNEYTAVQDQIDSISGNDYVIDQAQGELGMVPQA